MALELAKAAAKASEMSFIVKPTFARWRKHREAAKYVEVLVDAQKRCAEAVNKASGFRVNKGKKQK